MWEPRSSTDPIGLRRKTAALFGKGVAVKSRFSMKTLSSRFLFGLITTFSLAALPAAADLEVTASVQIRAKADFEAPLAPHGAWVEVGSYGRCWRPAHVAVGWRPYAAGEWVWTDCGWYWSSDEPWAWACYHYGSWVYDPASGWVWVPQVEWAPAWVSWRVGGGYIGWAPLPPPGLVFATRPDPGHFVFMGEAKFGGPVRPGGLIMNDPKLFKTTAAIGGMKRESHTFGGSPSQRVMVNQGPNPEQLQKVSGKRFAAVPIREAAQRTAGPTKNKQPSAEARAGKPKDAVDKGSDHGADRAEAPKQREERSTSNRDPRFDRDPGRSDNWGGGGRSMGGGGHGRH